MKKNNPLVKLNNAGVYREEKWLVKGVSLEINKKEMEVQKLEDSKTDIGWGNQIRSYVLDQSRIKDLRTNVETGNTQNVLDGDIDIFIRESLKKGM